MQDLADQIAKLKEEYQKEAKKLFQKGIKELFEKIDGLKSFSWTQYTPYFNDGEACEFGVNNTGIKVNNEYEEYNDKYTLIRKFLQSFEVDVYLDMFGDHCEVTVYQNKIVVEEYEHN